VGPLIAALIAVGLLAAWEALVRLGLVSALFFPAPTTVARTIARFVVNGQLADNLARTLLRLLIGFSLGALPAVALGLGMGWSRRLRSVTDPFVAALHPVPKTSLLPLFMIILGLGESSKVVVPALAAFFPILINSMAGVRQISPIHFEVAENYRAGRLKVFTRVVLPGALPLVLAGVRVAFNTALHVVIAVELLSAQKGLGAMIWWAWETMRTEQLYAGITVAAVLGIAFNTLLKRLSPRLVPWQVEHQI
jgi:ABC-type nitrate/sulfonate/bicarbonate transport system permease component